MGPRLAAAAGAALLAATTAGCMSGDDGADAGGGSGFASLAEARDQIMGATRQVSQVLGSADLEVAEATGTFTSCGSDPGGTDEYRAGGTTASSGVPLEQRVATATTALRTSGWQVTDSGASPTPYVRLTKDGLRLAVDRTALRGSNALAFTVSGGCVAPADGQRTDYSQTDTIID